MSGKAPPVLVIGPGAVGTMLAARLLKGTPGRGVCLAGSSSPGAATAAHLNEIEKNGVRIHGEAPGAARPAVCRGAMNLVASHLFFAVKAGQVGSAAAEFAAMAGDETIVAVLSNGVDVCGQLPDSFRRGGVVRGLVNTGAEITGPGSLNQYGALDITLAPLPGDPESASRVRGLAGFFESSGIRVRQGRDAKEAEWRKAVANAVINPLGAVLGLRNGELLDTPAAAARVDLLARELQPLIDAEGMAFDALSVAQKTARATAGNRNSMWQDLMRGRRCEIREVTGRLIEYADARGVPLPAHQSLYEEVLALERDAPGSGEGDGYVDIGGPNP